LLKQSKSALIGFLLSSVIFHAVLGSTANAQGVGHPVQAPALSQLHHIFERPDSTALTVLTDEEMAAIKGAYPWWWYTRTTIATGYLIGRMFITRKWTRIGEWNYRFHFDTKPHDFSTRINRKGKKVPTLWSHIGLGGNRHHWQITRYKLQRDKNGQLTLPKSKSTLEHIRKYGIEYQGIKGQRRQGWRVPWGPERQQGGSPIKPKPSSLAADSPESYDSQEDEIVFMEMVSMPNEIAELLKSEIAAASSAEYETLGAASAAPTPLSASCSGFIGVTDLCQYPSLAKPAPGYVAPAISQMLAASLFGLIDSR